MKTIKHIEEFDETITNEFVTDADGEVIAEEITMETGTFRCLVLPLPSYVDDAA